MERWKRWGFRGVGLALLCASSVAMADVRVEGALPDTSTKVTLNAANDDKDRVLTELAKKAGWNLILHGDFHRTGKVTLDVTDADAKDVLEAILADGSFVIKTRGEGSKLLEITALPAAPNEEQPVAAGVPAAEVAPAGIEVKGKRDRAVLGQNLRVEKDEIVGDVSVTGGSADIYGKVDGDLVVTGGSATVHQGGHVTGDALAIGGRVHVAKGGKVDGGHKVIGGVFTHDDEASDASGESNVEPKQGTRWWSRTKQGVSDFFGSFTFLFVVGALFLATAPERMLRLRSEVAKNPLASVVYGLGGILALTTAIVVLCVTVIGIPFAAILTGLALVAIPGALAATLTTAGAALLGHRSQNHYVHLALGCLLFAGSGVVPWLGGWLQIGAVLAACGILVTTRVAGFVPRKDAAAAPSSGLPYR